jgi:tetratricopeptide (TPR) repeat protein
MYLRTPKRYSRGQRRSIISLRWLWLWILTPLVVVGGMYLYNNRSAFIPQVEGIMSGLVNQAQSSVSTAMAPTPLPTENPTIRLSSADSAWMRGAIEEAVAIYEGLIDAVPNNVGVHYRLALGLIISGRREAGLQAAERAVTADPYDPNAWAIRAMALDWNGRYGEAVASAQRALELAGPDNLEAQARANAFLAEAYFDLAQYDRALSTANRAIDANPESYEAYRNRAIIVQNTQFDFAAALRDLQTAYELAPNLPYIAVDLAVVRSRDDLQSALALLTEVIDLNPRNVSALRWLGSMYLNAVGDPNQAADYLTRCVDVDPANITCHYVLGRAQVRTEQYALASESFKRAIDLGSTNPYHYWWAGRAQVLLGSCPGATQYLQTGYQLAQQARDEALIGDYEDQMRSCRLLVEATEEPEATEDAADGGS